MKKTILFFCVSLLLVLTGCSIEHSPNEVFNISNWVEVNATYDQIELNWDSSYFIHNDNTISIPDDWYAGVIHQEKTDFDDVYIHDILFQYKFRIITYYNHETYTECKFVDLDEENPESIELNFIIDTNTIEINNQLIIQDEWINDYYFIYDFNDSIDNFCYFKISKHDITQINDGSFNEIRVNLIVLTHLDGSQTFKIKEEDGLVNVGYYSAVGIYLNTATS